MTTLPLNATAAETDDIPTNAAATGVHDSLVAALAHADLVTTLQGDRPIHGLRSDRCSICSSGHQPGRF